MLIIFPTSEIFLLFDREHILFLEVFLLDIQIQQSLGSTLETGIFRMHFIYLFIYLSINIYWYHQIILINAPVWANSDEAW